MRSEAIRTVISFLKRLMLVEFIVVAGYIVVASVGYYAKIYRDFGFDDFVSFQIAQAAFVFFGQSGIIAILFYRWRRRLMEPSGEEFLVGDEHEKLERKSTFRWDLAAGKVNKNLEKAAMKTVAGFLNADGGHLIIGVGDDRSVVGIDPDCATLARKDADGLTNHFGNVFNTMIGAHVRHLVSVKPLAIRDTQCMLVAVSPSPQPVYVSDDGKEEFFVRTGNGTTSMKLSETQAYIEARWPRKR